MSYDPLADDEKLRRAIQEIHAELKDKLGLGVKLSDVCAKFQQVYGVTLSEEDCAKYLDQSLQSKRQGETQLAERAHGASNLAAESSSDAAESGTLDAHARASILHSEAASALRSAADFHDHAAKWHDQKARGEFPSELEAQ